MILKKKISLMKGNVCSDQVRKSTKTIFWWTDISCRYGNPCVQAAFRCFNLTERKNVACCCCDVEARQSLHQNLASVAYGKCCIFQSGWRRKSRIIFGFLDAFYKREEDGTPPLAAKAAFNSKPLKKRWFPQIILVRKKSIRFFTFSNW